MPKKGSQKATVGFLHVEPATLHWNNVHLILSGLHEKKGEDMQKFKECVVFLEDAEKISQKGTKPGTSEYDLPLVIQRVPLEGVKELLDEKIRHEEQSFKRKHPGTPSTRAPIYLTPDTYVLVGGSVDFLHTLIGLFFSELGAIKLRQLFIKTGRLREWQSSKSLDEHTFYEYDTQDEKFDSCNLDALAQKLRLFRKGAPDGVGPDVLSPEEVQQRLFGRGRMAAQD